MAINNQWLADRMGIKSTCTNRVTSSCAHSTYKSSVRISTWLVDACRPQKQGSIIPVIYHPQIVNQLGSYSGQESRIDRYLWKFHLDRVDSYKYGFSIYFQHIIACIYCIHIYYIISLLPFPPALINKCTVKKVAPISWAFYVPLANGMLRPVLLSGGAQQRPGTCAAVPCRSTSSLITCSSPYLDIPGKINMEPTNHPFGKENDLPNLQDYVPC